MWSLSQLLSSHCSRKPATDEINKWAHLSSSQTLFTITGAWLDVAHAGHSLPTLWVQPPTLTKILSINTPISNYMFLSYCEKNWLPPRKTCYTVSWLSQHWLGAITVLAPFPTSQLWPLKMLHYNLGSAWLSVPLRCIPFKGGSTQSAGQWSLLRWAAEHSSTCVSPVLRMIQQSLVLLLFPILQAWKQNERVAFTKLLQLLNNKTRTRT
jgi:hypothetical protein